MTSSSSDSEYTVLVVDDDDAVRGLITTVFRRRGYRVLDAVDGQEALRVAGEHADSISLIVTDVNMPHMGGWMLLERLRERCPTIRFLLISGNDHSVAAADTADAVDAPTAFLAKPFTPGQLSSAAAALLEAPISNRSTLA